MRTHFIRIVATVLFALVTAQALADNWNVVRLRGNVSEMVDGAWQPLKRGDVVPDERVVRTSLAGRVTLTRGNETIELGPNTQIQIYDQGGRKPFTTVLQHFGTVVVEAEVRDVQHFAVKNEHLAAVVKGTRFVVTASRSGGTVEVQRGQVQVDASGDGTTTTISAGQRAQVKKGRPMNVAGKGKLPAVVMKSTAKNSPKGGAKSGEAGETTMIQKGKPEGDSPHDKSKPQEGKNGKPDDEKPGKDKTDDDPGKSGDKPEKGDDKGGGGSDGKGKNDDEGKSDDNSGKGKSEDGDKNKNDKGKG